MKFKVFIDGAEGTTGLKIYEYFNARDDITVLNIDQNRRKDPDARLSMMKKADISFLCLPDSAAEEIAAAAPSDVRLIDTSTIHRVRADWTYGLAELDAADGKKQREMIRESSRTANPGCHATGAITLIRPLVKAGVLKSDPHLSVISLTGYSGGGKKMIAAYEDSGRSLQDQRSSPGAYALGQSHKHIPEILKMTGLTQTPAFIPIVADYYSGMQVMIPISPEELKCPAKGSAGSSGAKEIGLLLEEIYREYYDGEPMIGTGVSVDENGFIYANRLAGSNRLEISVHGNEKNIVVTATFDNLGKGASGAAVQNMNIILGIEETKGLI